MYMNIYIYAYTYNALLRAGLRECGRRFLQEGNLILKASSIWLSLKGTVQFLKWLLAACSLSTNGDRPFGCDVLLRVPFLDGFNKNQRGTTSSGVPYPILRSKHFEKGHRELAPVGSTTAATAFRIFISNKGLTSAST